MQIKQIKVGRRYQTSLGIGDCVAVAKTSAKFDFGSFVEHWLSAKEVDYELPKQDQPKNEPVPLGALAGFKLQKEAHAAAVDMFADKTLAEIVTLADCLGTIKDRPCPITDMSTLPGEAQRNIVALAWMKITDIAASRKLKGMADSN